MALWFHSVGDLSKIIHLSINKSYLLARGKARKIFQYDCDQEFSSDDNFNNNL